jgi:DNA-directed RNA polymerase subunit alpha
VREPFEKGYALTVGNSLRRTLLSIVPGAAVSWVKIDGVRANDTKVPGRHREPGRRPAQLKKLAVQVPSDEPRVLRMEVTGPKQVKGEDVPETGVEVLNPEVQLFTLEAGAKITLELGVGIGAATRPPTIRAAAMPSGAFRWTRRSRRSPRSRTDVEMSAWARSPTTRSWCWRYGPTAP